MIPRDYITEWRAQAPWVSDSQVEQDLIISRGLVAIFSHPLLRSSLAFRGGTALYKLFLNPPARFSEDIDLVQVTAEPAGLVMTAMRDVLNPWLGKPGWKQSEGRVTFFYRFQSEDVPPLLLRLKVEINTREHFAILGFMRHPFAVNSRWFHGDCEINTYSLNELLATKLRALYQRSKGRDLFDLAVGLASPSVDPDRVVHAFVEYMKHGNHSVSRAEFELNLRAKLGDSRFTADIGPLLANGFAWDIEAAAEAVRTQFIGRVPELP